MAEKSPSHSLDVQSNKKKGNPIAKNTKKPHGVQNVESLLPATEFVLPGKDRECVSHVDNAISQSAQNKRAKRKQRNRSTDISYTDDTGACADNPSSSCNVVVESVNKKNNETVSGDQNSFVEDNLNKNLSANLVSELAPAIGSDLFEKSDNSSVGDQSKSKQQHDALFTMPTQEVAFIMSQAGPNFTSGIGSSAADISNSGLMNKGNNDKTSESDHLTSVVNEGSSSKTDDTETSKNVTCLEIVSKSNDLESSKSRKRSTSEKQGKNTSSNTSAEACCSMHVSGDGSLLCRPSLEETVEDVSEKDSVESSISVELKDLSGAVPVKDPSNPSEIKNPSDPAEIRKVRKKKAKLLISEERALENTVEQKNENDVAPLLREDIMQENVEAASEDKHSVSSSTGNNLRLPIAEENCGGIEKGPLGPVEVKGESNPVETEGLSDPAEHLISEEKASHIAVEQKNEGNLVPLVMEDTLLETVPVLERSLTIFARKKLLVLDLNGLLCDVVHKSHRPRYAHKIVGNSSVFRRPFCNYFLKFCYERFVVGVWSSRRKENVDAIVRFIVGDVRNLSFCWDVSRCTFTGYKTIEDEHKPLVLKELKKLWNREEADLPWQAGDYSPSNTLLIDDSPYKALCNPPHTGIFPHPFSYWDKKDDSLGPQGNLKLYLEELSLADDVQQYVREHPFGKRAITASNASWEFYKGIISRVESASSKTEK